MINKLTDLLKTEDIEGGCSQTGCKSPMSQWNLVSDNNLNSLKTRDVRVCWTACCRPEGGWLCNNVSESRYPQWGQADSCTGPSPHSWSETLTWLTVTQLQMWIKFIQNIRFESLLWCFLSSLSDITFIKLCFLLLHQSLFMS